MSDVYDCQTCGACCFSPWTGDGYVRLYDIDLERLRESGLPVIHQEQGGDPPEVVPKLGTKIVDPGSRGCVAFEGRLGESCTCGIYELRPEACRKFPPGGALCKQARQRMGLPV